MGVAVSIAYRLGLHRDPGDFSSRRHQRTLWWTVYVRDALLALAFRRAPLIEDEEYSVRLPTVNDFESVSTDMSDILPPERWRQIAIIFVEKAKLAVFIHKMLSSQKPLLQAHHRPRQDWVPMPGPGQLVLDTKTTRKYIQHLEDWQRNLPQPAQCSIAEPAGHEEQTLYFHRALLQAIYLSFLIIPHRTQLQHAPYPSPDDGIHEQSSESTTLRYKISSATDQLLKIVQDLQERGMMQSLPTTDVLIIFSAFIASASFAADTGWDAEDEDDYHRRQQQRRRIGALLRNVILPRFQQDFQVVDDPTISALSGVKENACHL